VRGRKHEEEQNQVAFAAWFRTQYRKYQDLINIASFGEAIGAQRMNRLKRMGLTPGYPDINIFVPSAPYHGLLIEMKIKGERVKPHQLDIHDKLRKQGYFVGVAYNWEEAKHITSDYLDINPKK